MKPKTRLSPEVWHRLTKVCDVEGASVPRRVETMGKMMDGREHLSWRNTVSFDRSLSVRRTRLFLHSSDSLSFRDDRQYWEIARIQNNTVSIEEGFTLVFVARRAVRFGWCLLRLCRARRLAWSFYQLSACNGASFRNRQDVRDFVPISTSYTRKGNLTKRRIQSRW